MSTQDSKPLSIYWLFIGGVYLTTVEPPKLNWLGEGCLSIGVALVHAFIIDLSKLIRNYSCPRALTLNRFLKFATSLHQKWEEMLIKLRFLSLCSQFFWQFFLRRDVQRRAMWRAGFVIFCNKQAGLQVANLQVPGEILTAGHTHTHTHT